MLEASRRRIHRLACKPAAVFLVHVCTFATEDADANVQKKKQKTFTRSEDGGNPWVGKHLWQPVT